MRTEDLYRFDQSRRPYTSYFNVNVGIIFYENCSFLSLFWSEFNCVNINSIILCADSILHSARDRLPGWPSLNYLFRSPGALMRVCEGWINKDWRLTSVTRMHPFMLFHIINTRSRPHLHKRSPHRYRCMHVKWARSRSHYVITKAKQKPTETVRSIVCCRLCAKHIGAVASVPVRPIKKVTPKQSL